MAHPQSSWRGLWAKNRIDIGSNQLTGDSTGIVLNQGIKISNKAGGVLTANTTSLLLPGGVQISAARSITADSTGFVLTAESALPGNVDGGNQFTLVSNSTGVALAVNSTGTTWKYLNVTTAQPT